MKVLIVGPTGPVGRRLAARLAEAGHALVLFARRPDRVDAEVPAARVVEGEVDDRQALLGAAEGCEVCFHMVGWSGYDFAVPKDRLSDLWRINVQGTRNVCAAVREAGVRRLVYTSTHLTGGETRPERWTPYLVSRHLAEGEVFKAGAQGTEAVVLAPALVAGAPGPFQRLLVDLSEARIPLFPEETRLPVVSLEDVVEAHVAALDRGVPGTRYLLQGGLLGWRRLGDLVGLVTGWPVVMRPVSHRTANLAGRMDAALLARVRRRAPVGQPERVWALTHESTDDPKAAERELGLTYSDVEARIRAQLEDLVGEHHIGGD